MSKIDRPILTFENKENPEIIERDLNSDDIDIIIKFDHKAYFVENNSPRDHFPAEFTREEIEEWMTRGDIVRGLFNRQNEIVAYYQFELRPSELYLNLVVDRSMRNRGIGHYIMDVADYEAKKRDLNKCTLTVDPLNGRGVHLYLSSGYKAKKYFKNHFGPNSHRLWMEKDLTGNELDVNGDEVEVLVSDDDSLENIFHNQYIGVALIRDPNNNPKFNKLLLKKLESNI